MKTTVLILGIGLFSASTFAGGTANNAPTVADNPLYHVAIAQRQAGPAIRDPLRKVGDQIFALTGPPAGWVSFCGRVWNVQPGGICVKGQYNGSVSEVDFFVANFPYDVVDDQSIGFNSQLILVAKEAGTYTYATAIGGTKTLRKLDYGAIYVPPPPTAEQIQAAKKAAEAANAAQKKNLQAGAERALKSNQADADKGDAYGLLRMGERYRDGEGVEKDLAKARDYLTRAALAGSDTAQHELDQLPK